MHQKNLILRSNTQFYKKRLTPPTPRYLRLLAALTFLLWPVQDHTASSWKTWFHGMDIEMGRGEVSLLTIRLHMISWAPGKELHFPYLAGNNNPLDTVQNSEPDLKAKFAQSSHDMTTVTLKAQVTQKCPVWTPIIGWCPLRLTKNKETKKKKTFLSFIKPRPKIVYHRTTELEVNWDAMCSRIWEDRMWDRGDLLLICCVTLGKLQLEYQSWK